MDMVTRKVTANLPEDLLQDACTVSGKGITQTLIEALRLLRSTGALPKARQLKGKLQLDIDLEVSRERARRR
jgi:hypothetical protein